jgi:hypothetical protein
VSDAPFFLEPGPLPEVEVKPFDPGPRRRYEWAVLEDIFRGVHVHKGGLGSREEAEAWLAALALTFKREDHAHFLSTDGMVCRGSLWIGRREIMPWEQIEE